MDEWTKAHLERWCYAQTRTEDEAAALADGMLAFLFDADDLGYWLDKGWPAVLDAAREMGYLAAEAR